MLTQTYTKIPWFFASFCLRWRVRPLLIRFVSSRGHFNSSSFSFLLPFQFLCLRQFVFDVDMLILFYAPHVEKKSSTFFGGGRQSICFGKSNNCLDVIFVARQICFLTSKALLLDVKFVVRPPKLFCWTSKCVVWPPKLFWSQAKGWSRLNIDIETFFWWHHVFSRWIKKC